MSDKWLMITLMVLSAVMFCPVMISEYGKNHCRIEAIKAGISADKIPELCGIKQ
jgi:hypothetical protein